MALLTKAQAGKCNIHFEKLETGNGIWSEDITDATALKSLKQSFAFSMIEIPDGNTSTVVLEAVLNNRDLEELYYLREMGVYAIDPDDGSIMYAIAVADEDSVYLPANNGMGISTITERINIEVANAESVTINTSGAVVAASDFLALKKLTEGINGGITGGTAGQHLEKTGSGDYEYAWADTPVFVGSRAKFPATGRDDSVYIDSDSSSIYVWEDNTYKKLSLGADAAENLQAQVTANKKSIDKLNTAVFAQTDITVSKDAWKSATESGVTVYTNEIAVAGLTADTQLTAWPHLISTDAAAIVQEQKAVSVFFSKGKAYADAGKVVLKSYGKAPASSFGIRLQGVTA